jgi:hypothetical protein
VIMHINVNRIVFIGGKTFLDISLVSSLPHQVVLRHVVDPTQVHDITFSQ